MKDHKWDLVPFSFYDRTGMEHHLERRAAQGWLLERITNLRWHYRRIVPQTLHFTVTHYLRASQFDPEPSEEQRMFHEFCLQSGWKLAASSGQLQVFYHEGADPVPIDTEPALELERIGKIARRTIPFQFLLLAIWFCMGGSWCYSLIHSPIDLLSSAYNLVTGLIWLGLFLWCAADLTCYFTWRYRAKRAAMVGEFVPTKGCHKLLLAVLAVTAVGMVYLLLADRRPGFRLTFVLMLGALAALYLIVNGVKNFLKRKKAPAAINRGVTLAVDILLAVLLMVGITAGLLWAIRTGAVTTLEELSDPPLFMEDLTGRTDDRYITQTRTESTVFLTRRSVYQHMFFDQIQPGESVGFLDYTIVDIHLPILYGWCLEELLHDLDSWGGEGTDGQPFYRYVEMDGALWGAEAAYQLWADGTMPSTTYLICWPGRIVELEPTFELTREQMAIAGQALGTP